MVAIKEDKTSPLLPNPTLTLVLKVGVVRFAAFSCVP